MLFPLRRFPSAKEVVPQTTPALGDTGAAKPLGRFLAGMGALGVCVPGSLQSLAQCVLYALSRTREIRPALTATPSRCSLPLGWLETLRRQPLREMRGNLALSGFPEHTVALVPWKSFGFIAQLPSC